MKEQDFLQQVAARLGRTEPLTTRPQRTVVGAPEFWQEYTLPFPQRTNKFKDELEKLGGHVTLCSDFTSLHHGLRALLQELSPNGVGIWGGTWSVEFGLPQTLEGYNVSEWNPDEADERLIERFSFLDVGITGCDYAIADTGSVVLLVDKHQGRSVSLLPAVHVVLVRESQIRTRMGEVFVDVNRRFSKSGSVPSSINFISGPSRSSDIENDLSIGVHGPAAEYVFVLLDALPA